MLVWTHAGFGAGQPPQHLDDLEDILNSPAPALDSAAHSTPRGSSDMELNCDSPAQGLPHSTAEPQPDQSLSSTAQPQPQTDSQSADLSRNQQFPASSAEESGQARKLSVWSTAYQSASTPITAVWARVPEHLQRLKSNLVHARSKCSSECAHHLQCQGNNQHHDTLLQNSPSEPDEQQSRRLPFLLDQMGRNKAATAAATVAGAAAGGAIAGPFGIAAGMLADYSMRKAMA